MKHLLPARKNKFFGFAFLNELHFSTPQKSLGPGLYFPVNTGVRFSKKAFTPSS